MKQMRFLMEHKVIHYYNVASAFAIFAFVLGFFCTGLALLGIAAFGSFRARAFKKA